jgi:hypothetical protein
MGTGNMTTHQKDARLFMQLNHPDVETYCHNLPEPDRAFARAKAREIDAAKLPAKESGAQTRADREVADEEQREVERRLNVDRQRACGLWRAVTDRN